MGRSRADTSERGVAAANGDPAGAAEEAGLVYTTDQEPGIRRVRKGKNSLTLVQKKEGKDPASVDSIGAMLGAIAMIVFAVFVALTVKSLGPVPSILIALIVWLGVAVGLYFLVAVVFEREPHPR